MSKRLLASIVLLMFIRGLFDIGYIYFVSPLYEYMGFYLEADLFRYGISWLAYLSVFFITPAKLRRVSDAVFMMVTVSVIAPLTSMYGLSEESFVPVAMAIVSMFIVYWITKLRMPREVHLPYVKNGEKIAIVSALAVVTTVAVHYLMSGVQLNLNLLKVYEFRASNDELASTGMFSYLNMWAFQVFSLFLIAVFLMRKQYISVLIIIALQVFFFAASQHKSALFSPLIILGAWWYFRKSNNLLIIPMSVAVLIGVSLLLYVFFGNILIPSLTVRRIFFVPAHLSFEYYSFFSMNPKVLWATSSWMPFFQNPYPVEVPYVIGGFIGYPNAAANNGYVSSGFAHAGFFGVFLYTLMLGYVLKFIDKGSRSLSSNWLGVGLFLLPIIITWRSSDLLTSMMTHGILIMLVLLGLLRRPECGAATVLRRR